MQLIHERLKQLRKELGYNQSEFSKLLGLGQSTLGMLEVGKRTILDRHIKTVCSVFNINEHWLRTGQGEMFVDTEEITLDEYAKNKKLSDLEIDIIKGYLELDEDLRKTLITHFKSIFRKHDTETVDDSIENELNSYRSELEAEKKGIISPVSDDSKGKSG